MERIPDVSARTAIRADVSWDELPDGRIAIHKKKLGPVRRRMLRAVGMADELTIRLDAIGSAAWTMMDGRRTVGEIHVHLSKTFPDEPDLGPRLGRYLSILVSNDLIKLE